MPVIHRKHKIILRMLCGEYGIYSPYNLRTIEDTYVIHAARLTLQMRSPDDG